MQYKDGFYLADPTKFKGGLLYCEKGEFFAFYWECGMIPGDNGGDTRIAHSDILDYLGDEVGPVDFV